MLGSEQDLLREAMVLSQVAGHPNVTDLLGVVTSGAPTLLVLKHCSNGSLLNLLHNRAANGKCESRVRCARVCVRACAEENQGNECCSC